MYGEYQRGRGRPNRRFFGNSRGSYKNSGSRNNPLNKEGNVSTCAICGSRMHWAKSCPHSYERTVDTLYSSGDANNKKEEEVQITLLTQDDGDAKMERLLGETIGAVVLGSGCSRTVCGTAWLDLYLDTLDEEATPQIQYEESSAVFRFGNGKKFTAQHFVKLPCVVAGKHVNIKADVVSCNIPLLLSKESMKNASMVINMNDDTTTVFGKQVSLMSTTMGHYILPICAPISAKRVNDVLVNTANSIFDKVEKLHKQFAHPSAERLKKFLRTAGRNDPALFEQVEKVSESCQTCIKYKKPKSMPVVAMSMGTKFNETIAVDLKARDGDYFLVMLDVATRFCQAAMIHNKRSESIIHGLFSRWISLFGAQDNY